MMSDLLSNPFFAGGIALMSSAALMTLCRNVPKQIWRWLMRRLTVTIDVTNDDPIYNWLRRWLDSQDYSGRARRVSASVAYEDGDDGFTAPRALFTPAAGQHFFRYKGKIVWLSRHRDDIHGKDAACFWRKEELVIRLFSRDQACLRELIKDAERLARGRADGSIQVWCSVYGKWRLVAKKRTRDIESVVLPGNTAQVVIETAQDFLSSAQRYLRVGAPYRLGCLFEGVPGSGKSSLVHAMAGRLGLDIYIINLGAHGMDDERLNDLMLSIPGQALVLFEDIDAAFLERKSDSDSARVTFSGLLNAIDGVAAKEGRILVMTTNHAERLDPALTRVGRADLRVHFDYATQEQMRALYVRSFPGATEGELARFVRSFPDQVSMSAVQFAILQITRDGGAKAAVSI